MNGNPTCQCEAGYGATAAQVYDQTTGATSTKVSCEKVGANVPAFPILPKIGQAQLAPDRGGSPAAGSSGGCDVSRGAPGRGSSGALLVALGAIVAASRKRHARGRS
jgi:hypothetical protein